MAPRLTPSQERGAEQRRRARATFSDPAPCEWCGALNTKSVVITPAKITNGRIETPETRAHCCFECVRRLGLGAVVTQSAADLVKLRKERIAWARAERRAHMQANQGVLFSDERRPTNAITGG